MNAHDPQEPLVDWSQLEDQLKESERRAESIHWGQLDQQVAGFKDLLRQILPETVMAPFEEQPRQPSDLPIAPDGNPIVTSFREAYGLAKEHPELAATMAETAYNQTIAAQQQLDVDIEVAKQSGDDASREEVETERAKLQEKIDRIEFWSAVVSLHPISGDYIKEKLPHQFGRGNTHQHQVKICMRVEDEFNDAAKFVALWSPQQIAANREAAKNDPNAPSWANQWIDDMERRAEDKYVEMQRWGEVLTDTVYGQTHPDGKPAPIEEIPPRRSAIEMDDDEEGPSKEQVELLRKLPGLDPILEVMAGRRKRLPKKGWIINARLWPGSSGGATVTQFTDGQFKITDHSGSVEDGEVHLGYMFKPGKHGHFMVSYLRKDKEGNKSNYDWSTTTGPQDIMEMHDNKILKSDLKPMRALPSTLHDYAIWQDLDDAVYLYKGDVELSRITDDPDEAKQILNQLGLAMGMDEVEAGLFMAAFDKKDTFQPLEAESVAEKEARLRAETKHAERVLAVNNDGSRLIERQGDHIMIEADGSEWVAYSANSGLSYLGPDDYVGFYLD